MIRIRASLHGSEILSLSVTGHSGSAEKGEDLVCAAVSAVSFGLLNALDLLGSDADLKLEDNLIEIRTVTPDQSTETILKTGLIQLQTIEETNQKYVRIEKTEV